MSISTSLRRAAKLQEKIEELRSQLAQLLDRARSEITTNPMEEVALPKRGPGRPKALQRNGRKQPAKAVVGRPRGKTTRTGKTTVPKLPATRGARRRKRSPLLGVKRAASPSGPLAPAVVAVLKTRKQPMNVSDILNGLTANGYVFNSAEPKKNLAARIYRLKGVKQASAGLFEIA